MMNGEMKTINPSDVLKAIAQKNNIDIFSIKFAQHMDKNDPLTDFRQRFAYPKKGTLESTDSSLVDKDEDCIYLCGNSLGIMPLTARTRTNDILDSWAQRGAQMHFHEPVPAAYCNLHGRESLGRLLGCAPDSVMLMNGLSVNIHLLLLSFYKPTSQRYKILIEDHAFPSDRYAMMSQAELHGYKPEDAVLEVKPREGEHIIRTDDIIKLLETEGDSIAVVCLSGVQYYTGQKFDMGRITAAAHHKGCFVGWDLAHAIGNVRIELDDWGVDFAMWCTYKYLNSSPGCIGGAYMNNKHRGRIEAKLKGWWSNSPASRFEMRHDCDVAPGIESFSISNPPPLLVTLVLGSLEIFDEAGFSKIQDKQFLLTGYLELLIKSNFAAGQVNSPSAEIITPANVTERGSQLSLIFSYPLKKVHEELGKRGVVCDIRLPNVMRLAPVPLYNSFSDIFKFITILNEVFEICKNDSS